MFKNCLLYNTKKMEKAISQLAEKQFKQLGLHPTHAYILTIISKYSVVKTNKISHELALNPSTVTRMVKTLEAEGFVTKGSQTSPVDIFLTPKGEKLIPQINIAWDEFNKSCTSLLGENLAHDLTTITKKTNDILS